MIATNASHPAAAPVTPVPMPATFLPRRTHLVALALLPLASAPLSAQSTGPARAAGEWAFTMEGDGQPQRVMLTVDGDSLRGQVYGQALGGTLTGDRLRFRVGAYVWRASLRGDTLSGWLGIGTDSSRWRGVRFTPRGSARAFTVEPSEWSRVISGEIPPVLRLQSGDTVHTWSVDAGGWGRGAFGERANKRTIGGNPLTGPFYIDGTLPGDVLVVHLHRVRPNRDWAFSGTSLVDYAITPSYAAQRKFDDFDNKWVLDTAAGTAALKAPPAALADLRIPLRPFLGVVAVAPAGSVPSSRDSGPFGGNMEYAQLREGTTLYLPVQTTGAYLYLGDGHAAQGDGELTGDAMETSMDITFSVDVQRWKFASIPRAENGESLMSLGVAGSLDEAMRAATTDMASWLQSRYGLTASEAAVVMGFALQFDIPDLVPPYVGVSARMPKHVLRMLRSPRARP
jgi:amidase